MGVKDGRSHLESLRDGRKLYLDGRAVDDHTSHPAFRNSVRSGAALYDFQASPANIELMTFRSPTTGDPVSRVWQLPRTYQELVDRRSALTKWAELTCGMLGRSPDHVGSAVSAMYMGADLFESVEPGRARAIHEYYEYARDRDLYLSYAIVSPQADRSKGSGDQADEFLACGICDEDARGITLKGAKMLATAVPMANELLIASIQPLKPGEEKYSVTAMVPLNAPGLKLLSRRSYEQSALSCFDYPLSSRFDENDCVVYFDEVRVPWERVFNHRSVQLAQEQWHAIPTHVYQNYQCQIRLAVKLRFLVGLARKVAETNGVVQFPAVRDTLGFLCAQTSMIDGMLSAMEVQGTQYKQYWMPNGKLLYAAQVLSQQLYPEFIRAIRELAGGGLIMLPSSVQDLLSTETRNNVERVQKSPATDAIGRIKLMKLTWDAIGSEFGSRHVQYEMFYAGAPMVTRSHAFRTFDWDGAAALVEGFMGTYQAPKVHSNEIS
jgi:4-hydroxyphenylacetate 3-monooxygenase